MILAKFRQFYPQGSLVSELVDIDRGTYLVRVSITVDKIVLTTGLAGASKIETAEDIARERAIAALMLDNHDAVGQSKTSLISSPQTQNPTVTTTPKKTSSPQTVAANSASQPTKTVNYHNSEDSQVVNIPDYPPKKETQSNANISSSLEKQDLSIATPTNAPGEILKSETKVETETPDDQAVREATVETERQAVQNSANLFEGTSNLDLDPTFNNFAQDNPNASPETMAANVEGDRASHTLAEVNFNEIKHQTDLEIKRLGWTKDDGREFLKSRYGKRSRLHLTDSQLLEFLQYLASQPNPS